MPIRPSPHIHATTTTGRARHRFWLMLTVAILAAGALSRAVSAAPGPLAGLGVAVSGVILLGSLAATTRIMIAFDHARK